MTMISRIFGFVRDMVSAHMFGAAAQFDAFAVAFRIPNFMRRLFAEGSFSQAFVPVLSEYQKLKSKEEVQKFINAMSGVLGVTLLMVTVLGMLGAPWIVRLFAPGFTPGNPRYDLAVTLLRITFPYLTLISLTAFSGAILNTYSRFWVAAFTPVLLNICMITAAIWFSPGLATPIVALAWGVFVAGILQLLFQWPFLKNLRLLPHPTFNFKDRGVRRVLKLMVPALFGVSVGQINLLVDSVFASLLMVGSVSWLYYSDRLMEFPLGVFGVAISTVILPHLSRHHTTQREAQFSLTIDWAVRAVLLVGIPAAVVLAVMAGPLLSTLFQYGKFNAFAVIMASKSLTAFALGIAPFMLVKVLASGFYAKQDLRTPVKIGVVAMVANIGLNGLLILPLAHAGIALATSLAALINSGCLFYFLQKRGLYCPRAGFRLFALRLAASNGVLAIWLWVGAGDLSTWLVHPAVWRITHLAFLLVSAMLVYFAALWVTGIKLRHLLMPPQEELASTS
ncbi:MAG: murein biosynthesis integral membrane protein MurJ [Gammaproteobacteria bacterium RIFCSPHIGHO2_12_FULL_45_12]|nr:MAG: murein biosynthesis integral membrane protein MurJ [Gammaproteobacteria bacterium RIFCSPHIGHO2_12_FULL_45_12]